jgi:redox-sensitive bicupin YhaK (pirin superfamily)
MARHLAPSGQSLQITRMIEDLISFRTLTRVVRGHATSDGAGIRFVRALGAHELDHLDPFLLLEEFRSESQADYMAGFPDHPRRGFENITYMLAGSMEQSDHLGHRGLLESGGVQWMTAGRGVLHSQVPHQENGALWGFQVWMNLRSSDKFCEPRYQDIARDAIPEIELPNMTGKIRVIAGRCGELQGAFTGNSLDPLFLDVALSPHVLHDFDVPEGHNACVYVFEGGARFGDVDNLTKKALSRHDLGVLRDGSKLRIQAASTGVRFLLLAARPLNEPVARYGPFVMNTREQVLEAVQDFRTGRFVGDPQPTEPENEPRERNGNVEPSVVHDSTG